MKVDWGMEIEVDEMIITDLGIEDRIGIIGTALFT